MGLGENLILLGTTALLTGLLVPLVKGRMDDGKLARERVAEEELRRDSTFIDLQTELLADLSSRLWAMAGLALAVSYYHVVGLREQGETAWQKYDAESFSALVGLRAVVSRSQRLVSASTHRQVEELFDWWFSDLDPRVSSLARSRDTTDAQWQQHHSSAISDLFARTDQVLDSVAAEVGVSRRSRDATM